jgi:HAD superfamily hydrolase (TIGR01450 family)
MPAYTVDVDRYQGFIFDVDGVLFRGRRELPGARQVIAQLKQRGKKILIFSNNSRNDRYQFAEKFRHFPVTEDELYHGVRVAATYIAQQQPGARVSWIGSTGLQRELAWHGLHPVQLEAQPKPVDFLVVGFAPDLTFATLTAGVRALKNRARLVAVNLDRVFPQEEGWIPGAGGIVKALEYYAEVQAETVGKPSSRLAHLLLEKMALPAHEVAVVGDSLDSDVALGQAMGCTTIALLSGEVGTTDLERSQFVPDIVLDSIADMLQAAGTTRR